MSPVYPRWRGEHLTKDLYSSDGSGLSPLARGTLISASRTVYPRWRGEHNFCSMSLTPIAGLSPLARGTHHCSLGPLLRDRFIPAGAGNTRLRPRTNGWRTVYPRWRGEHLIASATSRLTTGLSPLARGTLSCGTHDAFAWRFIPAGAGNTLSIHICF